VEHKKKNDLDSKLKEVKQELANLETEFPKEIADLKSKIQGAKSKTEEYEVQTRMLADELKKLKAQAHDK
jgi:septation ring formation regulator EzrA